MGPWTIRCLPRSSLELRHCRSSEWACTAWASVSMTVDSMTTCSCRVDASPAFSAGTMCRSRRTRSSPLRTSLRGPFLIRH
jgi:hypothetical protein